MYLWRQVFSHKQRKKDLNLNLNGAKLEMVKEFKYLGITITQDLRWSTHINNIIGKAKKVFNMATNLIGRNWDLNAKRLMWVYNTVVRSIISYTVVAWAKDITKTMATKLESLQRIVTKKLTAAMGSAPTAALNALTGYAPLQNYITTRLCTNN